jgi:hypothetical protein
MRTIREFEERLHVDFGRGDIPGFVHLYAGEEAAGTGIMMHLGDGDRIASTRERHPLGIDTARLQWRPARRAAQLDVKSPPRRRRPAAAARFRSVNCGLTNCPQARSVT